MKRSSRIRVSNAAVATIAVVALVSCSSGATTGGSIATTDASSVEPSTVSSPFDARDIPSGYKFLVAGQGDQFQNWSSDTSGTDEPFTVLSPDGKAASPSVVVVSVLGYSGYEGLLDQASLGYLQPGLVHFKADNRDAVYAPAITAGNRRHGVDLVVARGPDLAVRVTTASATQEELVAIEKLVVPAADSLRAPTVPTLPTGLELVGHVDADVSIASNPPSEIGPHNVPGSKRAHAIAWSKGADELSVMTLPGTAADVRAFLAVTHLAPLGLTTRAVKVDGRPGVLYLSPGPPLKVQPYVPGKLRPLMLVTTTSSA